MSAARFRMTFGGTRRAAKEDTSNTSNSNKKASQHQHQVLSCSASKAASLLIFSTHAQ
jgi:hypothetical protein